MRTMQPNSPTHHIANAVAVLMPVTTVWAHAPEFVSVITGALGSIWYCVLIYSWFEQRRKAKIRDNQPPNP